MRFKPPNYKLLQGAVDSRRRARRRTIVLQVPDIKAGAVPCERVKVDYILCDQIGRGCGIFYPIKFCRSFSPK